MGYRAAGDREPVGDMQVDSHAMVQMLQARRVPRMRVLLTSAQYLPRAVRTFKQAWAHFGIEVIPFPADVTSADSTTIWSYLSAADAHDM